MIKTVASTNGHKETKLESKKEVIQLYDTPKTKSVLVTVESLTPFLSNRKHEGILEAMQDKTTGKKRKRELINPEEKWKLSQYLNASGQPCIPGIMFKKSMVNTAVFFNDKSFKRKLNGSVFIAAELIPLKYDKEVKRADVLPLMGRGSSHVAYRMEYQGWSVVIPVQFNEAVFSATEIFNILETAGFSVGVGDNRPERGGIFGRFRIKR